MDALKTFIQEGYAILAAGGISVGSLVLYAVSWLKTKAKAIDKNAFYKELETAKAEMEVRFKKEYDKKFEELQFMVVNHLESLENKVIGKIENNEEERSKAIKQQTMQLEATINAISNKASIDDILGE